MNKQIFLLFGLLFSCAVEKIHCGPCYSKVEKINPQTHINTCVATDLAQDIINLLDPIQFKEIYNRVLNTSKLEILMKNFTQKILALQNFKIFFNENPVTAKELIAAYIENSNLEILAMYIILERQKLEINKIHEQN